MKLLIVEDDATLARGLKKALQAEGYSVEHAASGEQAIALAGVTEPDMMILDLGLPDMEGTEVLRTLRKRRGATPLPILVLTARNTTADLVAALDLGADDYLKKPFEMAELSARVRALCRRQSQASSARLHIGSVTLDLAAHTVSVDEIELSLSRREFHIVATLMENAGRVQTKDALENKIYAWGEEVASNAIEAHISNVRKKLPAGFIQTVRGVGYVVHKSPAG